MKNWSGQFFIHLIGSLLFLSLPFLFSPEGTAGFPDIFQGSHTTKELFHYVLLLIFFYVNYYLLVPKLYFPQKYFLFVLAVLGCLLIIAFVPNLLIRGPGPGPNHVPDNMKPPFDDRAGPPPINSLWMGLTHNFVLFLAIFFFSLLLRIGLRWRESEKQKLGAELSYLKAQINPHFLFNTLNSIYSLAIEKSDNTATAIVKLSGMMRYITSESGKDFVALEKELTYISDYIDLQSLRFGADVNMSFVVNGSAAGKKIAPLLLIGYIENAFKYGVNAEKQSQIKISIDIVDETLFFTCFNKKVASDSLNIESEGLGIQNTKSRLDLLYPGKHELIIRDNANDFSVSLTLQLNDNGNRYR